MALINQVQTAAKAAYIHFELNKSVYSVFL